MSQELKKKLKLQRMYELNSGVLHDSNPILMRNSMPSSFRVPQRTMAMREHQEKMRIQGKGNSYNQMGRELMEDNSKNKEGFVSPNPQKFVPIKRKFKFLVLFKSGDIICIRDVPCTFPRKVSYVHLQVCFYIWLNRSPQ